MKYEKHKIHTIDEKNEIVKEYLNGINGYTALLRKYDISSHSVLHRWIKQYRQNGTTSDLRGTGNPNLGKYSRKKLIPEEMTREELIQYVEATEDIKKLMAYLNKQKKNIK